VFVGLAGAGGNEAQGSRLFIRAMVGGVDPAVVADTAASAWCRISKPSRRDSWPNTGPSRIAPGAALPGQTVRPDGVVDMRLQGVYSVVIKRRPIMAGFEQHQHPLQLCLLGLPARQKPAWRKPSAATCIPVLPKIG